MRRLAWLTIVALALAVFSAGAEAKDLWSAMQGEAEALSSLREAVRALCAEAREAQDGFIADYRAALDTLGTYDLAGFRRTLARQGTDMEDLRGRIADRAAALAAVDATDAGERAALTACRAYAADILSVAEDFLEANAFQQAQYLAAEPLNEQSRRSGESGQTAFVSARAWEKASAEVVEGFEALAPPAHLKSTWEGYLHQTRLFARMCVLRREGIGYGDVLRLYSSSQLLAREYDLLAKYELTLYTLNSRQYGQCAARLDYLRDATAPGLAAGLQSRGAGGFPQEAGKPELTLECEMADAVYPNLYHSMDSVANLILCTAHGTRELLVTAQVVGLTQEYRQKLTVGPGLARLTVKPPLLSQLPDMTSAKDTQLELSVTDLDTGALLVQESHPVRLYSLYDFGLYDNEFGFVNYDDILAWTTPESEGVLKVRRKAIDYMDEHDLFLDSLVGYQNPTGLPEDRVQLNTKAQAVAIQGAISDLGVRYNMGAFSLSAFQRILMPDAVVQSRSGVCVETAVLMASALQSANMHAMILFIPGHAQVALETWRDSAEYYLLETTMLPLEDSAESYDSFCRYLTQEEWSDYLEDCASRGVAYVVDCDLVDDFDYRGLF